MRNSDLTLSQPQTGADAPKEAVSRIGAALGAAKRVVPKAARPRVGSYVAQYSPRPLLVPRRYARTPPPDRMPLVSLVTPSLNQGEFIGSTLRSVVQQRYPRLEYFVADGGSADATLEILQTYRAHITEVHSGPDRGQPAAINATLDRASGEIFAWLNSDDLLLPGALAYVARYFARRPQVDLVYGHRLLIDESDAEIGLWALPPHSPAALRWLDLIPQETAFWRRDLWQRLGGLRDDLDTAFDWDFFRRAEAAGARIVRLPRFLGAMRQHPQQKTKRREREAFAEQEAIRRADGIAALSRDELRRRLLGHLLRSLPYQYWHLARARARLWGLGGASGLEP